MLLVGGAVVIGDQVEALPTTHVTPDGIVVEQVLDELAYTRYCRPPHSAVDELAEMVGVCSDSVPPTDPAMVLMPIDAVCVVFGAIPETLNSTAGVTEVSPQLPSMPTLACVTNLLAVKAPDEWSCAVHAATVMAAPTPRTNPPANTARTRVRREAMRISPTWR